MQLVAKYFKKNNQKGVNVLAINAWFQQIAGFLHAKNIQKVKHLLIET